MNALRTAARFDRAVTSSRPLWIGLGQLAVIVLGVHLAADRFDDLLYQAIAWTALPWPDPDTPSIVAAWAAVLLELAVVLRAAGALALTSHAPDLSWSDYKRKLSVEAVLLPVFWAPVALAGSWVVGMAVEDLLAGWNANVALAAGLISAAFVAWRVGYSGLIRVLGALSVPEKRTRGWYWVPLLLPVAWLAFRYGLPIWWWLA